MGIKPVKVSQLNNYIKRILQTDPILGNVSVVGEISNLKFHGSGHVYFSLKDESSKLNCFLASDNLPHINCRLKEGMQVVASGYVYLYEKGGSYSLNIKDIEEEGQGNLSAAFEKLKEKLQREGLFEQAHKKEIPAFPEKIAVVTSDTGAAIEDILKIITGKNDLVDIFIYPVLVQGANAPAEIASAIDDLNKNHKDVNIIITGRGGGSAEDLWAFNDEDVARSIYNSQIPVISAVGHETDFTIADFVADLRAETPTAAAEKAVPDTMALREGVNIMKQELDHRLKAMIEDKRKELELMNPASFGRDIQSRIVLEQMRADNMAASMKDAVESKLLSCHNMLNILKEILDASDPKLILAKGYSMVTDEKGDIIRDTSSLAIGQRVNIEAARGKAEAQITSVRKV
ncbi:MAG: exodeoxyribonuclease VII large subunit [Clostridiales bacterium]|nr:exodeoxyribonuclease VII large subunit [Clostridiales bacterium]